MPPKQISFNKPFLTGKELEYIKTAVDNGLISGDGIFTKKCYDFIVNKFNFNNALLTTSCSTALDIAGTILNFQKGDEIILPSFTFPSTANSFIYKGAQLKFCDSSHHNPNLDVDKIEELITSNTKAIIVMHYSGIACDMDKIIMLCEKYSLFLIEDAAQAINSTYKGHFLGSFGHFSAFSFHETKNIICGEGGMLVVNDQNYFKRAEIIREKGTNRSAFFRGEVDKYNWVDIGSSYLPSDMIAAFLFAQLENIDLIQNRRILLWNRYYKNLITLEKQGSIRLPIIPNYASNTGHIFYILCENLTIRNDLMKYLREKGIYAVFHYLPLHKSPFYKDKHDGRELKMTEYYSDCLLRLPMFFELKENEVDYITWKIEDYFRK